MVATAGRLAGVLRRENIALAALDFAQVAGLLAEKRGATEAFTLAQAASGMPDHRPEMIEAATRLRDLAAENRRLLERAIAVQSRVIGIIARAMPPAPTPRYAASGALTRAPRPIAFALSARA
jgi:hypothetical protein